jgi:dephospho-CoA kinase
MARNGWTSDTVQRIIETQASRAQKLAAADWVIYNDTLSLDELRSKVINLPIQTI